MILAAGLTPAWQQMLLLDQLRVGEVNRAREAHWCASGKVLNVGLALHHLGGPSLTLALVGGLAGEWIEREFAALEVRRRWVWSEGATRVCTTLLDQATGVTTELVENAPVASPAVLEAFRGAYAEAAGKSRLVVLSGSLPQGAPSTYYRELLELTPCRVVLDARGPELLECLALKPFVVKPNREELGKTLGRPLRTDRELKEAMEELHGLGAEWVLVSQGKKALWASGGGRLHVLQPPMVRTVNPIGCGDCLAAGLAWGVDQGMEMLPAICFGMGAAAENAAMLLPSRLELERVRARQAEVELVTGT